MAAGVVALAIAVPAQAGSKFTDNLITIHEQINVDGNPAAIWTGFGGWCDIPNWVPPILSCDVTRGNGLEGSLRVLGVAGLGPLEEIMAVRTQTSYTYVMTQGPLVPAQYTSTISAVPGPTAGTADVHWKTTILTSAFPDGGVGVTGDLSDIYKSSLANLKAMAET